MLSASFFFFDVEAPLLLAGVEPEDILVESVGVSEFRMLENSSGESNTVGSLEKKQMLPRILFADDESALRYCGKEVNIGAISRYRRQQGLLAVFAPVAKKIGSFF